MIHIPLLEKLSLRIKTEQNKQFVWDIVRKKMDTIKP